MCNILKRERSPLVENKPVLPIHALRMVRRSTPFVIDLALMNRRIQPRQTNRMPSYCRRSRATLPTSFQMNGSRIYGTTSGHRDYDAYRQSSPRVRPGRNDQGALAGFIPLWVAPNEALTIARATDPFDRVLDKASANETRRKLKVATSQPKLAKTNRRNFTRQRATRRAVQTFTRAPGCRPAPECPG